MEALANGDLLLGTSRSDGTAWLYKLDGSASVSAVSTGAASFHPVNPARILDTRFGNGTTAGIRAAGSTTHLQVAGRGGVPAEASAVVITLTSNLPQYWGFATAWPTGQPMPLASNLNYEPGQTVANQVIVPLGTGGQLDLYTSATVHLIADVVGYFSPVASAQTSGRYVPLDPSRILDTRFGNGAPVAFFASGSTNELQVTGRGGVPATGASAVVVSFTVTQPLATGWITAWPTGQVMPLASNLNYDRVGQTISVQATIPLGTGGRVSLYAHGTTHLIADVVGYYTDSTAPASENGLFVPLTPQRIRDTRTESLGAFASTSSHGVNVGGLAGVPLGPSSAVVTNMTVTQATGFGWLTLHPYGPLTPPVASQVLYDHAGATAAALTTVPLASAGRMAVYTQTATHVIVDVSGYYTG